MCTSTCGIHHSRVDNNDAPWGIFGNTPENDWTTGIGWKHPNNYMWSPYLVSMSSYDHLILVWDGASNVFTLYVNGRHAVSYASPNKADVGKLLAIGGLPYTGERAVHTFVGEVAMARVYDQTMSINQAAERFEELKSTIQTLNAAQ
jgi:hypothetical protein